jgi:hypothetical protein
MKSNIIAKIQKLLSLANSSNENEAKSAMNMANKLLLEYNLSIQQIADHKSEYEFKDVGEEILVLGLRQRLIIALLRNHFFVELVIIKQSFFSFGRTKYKKTIQLVGTKENCEIAAYIFTYLDRAYPELWKNYLKNNREIKCHKGSYYQGLTRGIAQMLEATKWKVQKEVGLVLKQDANLTNFVKQKFRATYGRSYSYSKIDQKAYNDGISDGSNITLRRPIKAENGENGFSDKLRLLTRE